MRITLSELRARESASIDLLEIMSLEGQRYMSRLHINDEMVVLEMIGMNADDIQPMRIRIQGQGT